MRSLTVLLPGMLAFSLGIFAQDQPQQPTIIQVRVESITWSPGDVQLTWVVTRRKDGPGGKTSQTQNYLIQPRNCVMSFNGEKRGFEPREGEMITGLLKALHLYAIESWIWWEMGKGHRLDKDGKPVPPPASPPGPPRPETPPPLQGEKIRAQLLSLPLPPRL